MADKIAELSINDGQPLFEIKVFKANDVIRGRFTIRLFNRADTRSVVIGSTGEQDVADPQGSFEIPFDGSIRDLDDRWIRFRVFAGDNDSVGGEWFLSIKITQNGKVVTGGDISFRTNLDSLGFIGNKVRLNVT